MADLTEAEVAMIERWAAPRGVLGLEPEPRAFVLRLIADWRRLRAVEQAANDYSSADEKSDSQDYGDLRRVAEELAGALQLVAAFLSGLERGTGPDDPLAEMRRKLHRQLWDAINPALTHAAEKGIK